MNTLTPTFHAGSEPSGATYPGGENHGVPLWLSRLVLISLTCGLAWHTWGHWGSFQIDNGRELYVPAQILKGKLLFRDLWYMYGPLAPYLKAVLFRIFGVRLSVLYGFGLSLTIATALITFEIARLFRLGPTGNLLPSVFFLTESFYPFIRNFIFPYSYAASLGAFLGLVCLFFALKHISTHRPAFLLYSALFSGLALLTKQEIGFACLMLLLFDLVSLYLSRQSWREIAPSFAICLSAFILPGLVYGWFAWKVGPKVLFFENWISTPGTYFMRTFSKINLPEQGFRLVPSEVLKFTEYALLGLLLWFLLASVSAHAAGKWRLNSDFSIAIVSFLVLLPLCLGAIAFVMKFPYGPQFAPDGPSKSVLLPVTQPIVPHGIFLIAVSYLLYLLWTLRNAPRQTIALQQAALTWFAIFLSVRQMMELRPSILRCSVFFNVPAFLVFVLVVVRIIRYACRSLDQRRQNTILTSFLAVEAALIFLVFHPKPEMLSTKFTSDYGSFYTAPDVAKLFPQIADFMKTHTKNGKDILMLPEPPSLYVFSGTEAPTKWYSLTPGVLDPSQESDFVRQAEENQVRYVLISDRSFNEYGVWGFINRGYSQGIYDWVIAKFVKVGHFGPLPEASYPPYIVWLFERKDLASAEGTAPETSPLPPAKVTGSPLPQLAIP